MQFGANSSLEHSAVLSLLYCSLEPTEVLKATQFAAYSSLDRLLQFGVYCSLEPTEVWSLLQFGAYCSLEPTAV